MLNLEQLYFQKIAEKLNSQINATFNKLIKQNLFLGRVLAFFVIFAKCILHTIAILVNTLEYACRGLGYVISQQGSFREYMSTLGSFLVINTINALTIIPDIFIRTFFTLRDSEINPTQTPHTFFYKIMRIL